MDKAEMKKLAALFTQPDPHGPIRRWQSDCGDLIQWCPTEKWIKVTTKGVTDHMDYSWSSLDGHKLALYQDFEPFHCLTVTLPVPQ